MTTPQLQSLSIESFRGCVELFKLDFQKGKTITLVYAENGNGKSTICDAFELLASGHISSLDNRGLGRTDKFLKSVAKKTGDPVVELKCSNCLCRVTVHKDATWTHNVAPGVPTCEQHKPTVEVLRRAQILDLITARAADRYKAIERFVNVENIETSEAALDTLIKSLRTEQESQAIRLQQSLDSLKEALPPEALAEKDQITWARKEAQRDFTTEDALVKANEAVETAFRRLDRHTGVWKRVTEALPTAEAAELGAKQAYESASHAISTDASNVVDILESAARFLVANPTPAQCPLCESAEKAAGLADRVTSRIASFRSLRDARAQLTQATRSLEEAKAAIERAKVDYDRSRGEFEKALQRTASIPTMHLPTACPADLQAFDAWQEANKALFNEWRTFANGVLVAKTKSEEIKRHLKAYDENLAIPASNEDLIPRLGKALAIVQEERKAFTDSILSRIALEVGRLYEIVHPGEGLEKISLQLDPKKRASLDLGADFLGKQVEPQAYFSESHLDTLGLCIFLALAKMENAAETILVIDDVLASVDEPHVERLIGMISEEAKNFRHCIITTHYRPWREKYRWGWLKNGQCQFVELGAWSKDRGLCTAQSVADVARLGSLLKEASPDLQAICGKAGVVLEALLDFLTQKYETMAPRRAGGRLTLGDLLPGIKKGLRAALRVDVLVGKDEDGNAKYEQHQLGARLDELSRIAQTRNVFGAHFNEISFDLLDADAIRFGTLVYELATIVTDEENGWPSSPRSGSYWATATDTRRLHPLKEPS
jgi:energy-coupling factor transporter ATP-binding protein EcfA2